VSRPDGRYVLVGATGQLGFDLARTFDLPGTLLTPRRAELDLLDARRTGERLRALRPTHVINTAAWNAVDAAENEPRRAFTLNAEAVGTLADACQALGAALVHFSTDYVFDGAKGVPYTEADAPNPISAYGVSKLGGERLAHERCEGALVIRVSGLFGIARARPRVARTSWRRCSGWPARAGRSAWWPTRCSGRPTRSTWRARSGA